DAFRKLPHYVHVTTKAQLRRTWRLQSPVVVSKREARGVADAERIPLAVRRNGSKAVVGIGIPFAIRFGCRTPEHHAVCAQLSEKPCGPYVVKSSCGPEAARILFIVVHVHDGRDADLPQVIDASRLLSLGFGLGQR